MPTDCITYQNSGYFSKLIIDYLNQSQNLKELYNRFPTIDNFQLQIEEKQHNFPKSNREILYKSLISQYANTNISKETLNNIELLKSDNTFTITTGHQLNLFTGPLYFLYKIISTINLAKELKSQYPNQNFVPIYWMATEDHDFEEINHFQFEKKKIQWNRKSSGPVGRLSNTDLDKVFDVFSSHLGSGNNANQIREWFKNSYINHDNLADATRYLANELFGKNGLIILDGDDIELKKEFAPFVQKELIDRKSIEKVEESFGVLKDYFIQVNPREINLFYIKDNLRERIIFESDQYKINNTQLVFSKTEIIEELNKYPERFSPNVILRPLYQEIVLPNLCYIGGGGELAYWLELKNVFKQYNITFPMLLLRNSVLLATKKQLKKIDAIGLSWKELFLKQDVLINLKTKELSKNNFDFNQQRKFLIEQFEELKKIAQQTDVSFIGAVEAQTKKQLKGLDNLEKRLLKAEKKVHQETLNRIVFLQSELFPNKNLQERVVNFSQFYKEFGNELLEQLFKELNPLEQNFNIVVL